MKQNNTPVFNNLDDHKLLKTNKVTKSVADLTGNKAPVKQKEAVKLREKVLANGNISLYLDVYWNGRRHYEFLKLYLINSSKSADKEKNRQTLQLAQSIKAKRTVEIQNHEYGFNDAFKLETNFIEYFKSLKEKRKKEDSKGNYGNWDSCLKHLLVYCRADTTFKDINTKFVEGFKDYLLNKARSKSGVPLSQNTQHSYFCKLAASIKQAVKDRIMSYNICEGMEYPKPGEPERDYLTVDEVRALAKTECRYPILKKAFLFSCLTGVRWSDIQKLVWSEVQAYNEGNRIVFKQKKTGGQEYLDINSQATELMGERGEALGDERIFVGLKYSSYHNVALLQWCMSAGINKSITFHVARHTFAIMMLELGVDLYTVSKLLGHKDIKTTQIYAKVLDKKKQEAVSLIPDINLKLI